MEQIDAVPARRRRVGRGGPSRRRVVFAVILVVVLVAVAAAVAALALNREPAPGGADEPVRTIVFVTYWDQDRGFDEVDRHGEQLQVISPWWYAPTAEGEVIEQHEQYTEIDLEQVRELQERGHEVMPSIANHQAGSWDFDLMGQLLSDESTVDAHVAALTDLVVENGFDGLQLDYENLDEADAERYGELVRRVSESFAEHDKTLAVAIHGKVEAETDGWGAGHDYALLGRYADELHLMAYDYHHNTSDPGPSAPLWWVNEVLRYATEEIPPEKIVLGIGLYGYDWPSGEERAEGVTLEDAETRVRRFDGELTFDIASQTPVFAYTDDGVEREMWFENPRSIRRKLELVDEHELGGAFFWRMGGTTPDTWEAVADMIEPSDP